MKLLNTVVGTAVSYRELLTRKGEELAQKKERGGPTLEHVIWAAVIAVAAVAATAVIVSAIQGWQAKIPRG